jgi:hypothetical protein
VRIIQLPENNARKNSSHLPVYKDRLLLRPQMRTYRNDRGGWIPASAGMTKEYWIDAVNPSNDKIVSKLL